MAMVHAMKFEPATKTNLDRTWRGVTFLEKSTLRLRLQVFGFRVGVQAAWFRVDDQFGIVYGAFQGI